MITRRVRASERWPTLLNDKPGPRLEVNLRKQAKMCPFCKRDFVGVFTQKTCKAKACDLAWKRLYAKRRKAKKT